MIREAVASSIPILGALAYVLDMALPRHLAVARGEAFCFYYDDNLELLERAGAQPVPFSSIRDGLPVDVDGVYIDGGYPELRAAALSQNGQVE